MKKLAIMVLTALIFTLTACSRDAIEASPQEIYDIALKKGPEVLAESTYKVKGVIDEAASDHLKIGNLKVYCDANGFNAGESVVFTGKITGLTEETVKNGSVMSLTVYVEFKDAAIQ